MADGIIFIGWDRPVPGREKQAMQLFQKSMAHYSKLKTDGRIENFEAVVLTPHGGDLNGFLLVRGDAKKLIEIEQEDISIQLRMEGHYCLDGFGVVLGAIGERLTNIFSQYSKLIGI